jgi:hypothetical protein
MDVTEKKPFEMEKHGHKCCDVTISAPACVEVLSPLMTEQHPLFQKEYSEGVQPRR